MLNQRCVVSGLTVVLGLWVGGRAAAQELARRTDMKLMPTRTAGDLDVGSAMITQRLDPKQFKGARVPEGMDISRRTVRNAVPTIWHVSTLLGFNGADGLSWASPFLTLNKALLLAQPGDEIWLSSGLHDPSEFYVGTAPGTSRFDSYVVPPNVTIRGGFSGTETSESHRNPTRFSFLRASLEFNYHIMQIWDAGTVELDHLFIERGWADSTVLYNDQVGGGILAFDTAITMTDCYIQNNHAQEGAGMYAQNCVLTLNSTLGYAWSSTFGSNTASEDLNGGQGNGGGLYMIFGGGLIVDPSGDTEYLFTNNSANMGGGILLHHASFFGGGGTLVMDGNSAEPRSGGSGGFGGGMYLPFREGGPTDHSHTLPLTVLTSNTAVYGGGLICTTDARTPASINITGLSSSSNTASKLGGGGFVSETIDLTITDSTFSLDSAVDGGGAVYAGGLLDLSSSTFSDCSATDPSGSGGAIASYGYEPKNIEGCSFYTNSAMRGSSIYAVGTSSYSIRRSSFVGGAGVLGSLMMDNNTSATLENLVFTGNTSGPAINTGSNSSISGKFLTITGNAEAITGFTGAVINIDNSVIHDNGDPALAIDPGFGTINISDSIIEGGYSGTNIIDADPLLDGNLYLSPSSPAIDAGNGALSLGIILDRAGNARELDDTGQPDTGVQGVSGFVPDMGAYEFTGTSSSPCPADLNNDGFLDSGDITAFVDGFSGGDLSVDFNNDGFLDSGDIAEFVDAFLAGC